MSAFFTFFHSLRMILYYAHERIWERISWGRIKHPLSTLPVDKEITPEDLRLIKNYLRDLGYID